MYHSISTEAAPQFRRFAVPPREFEAQMSWLGEHKYHSITAAEFVEARLMGRVLPARSVVLTFDDAFADFHSAALPILRRHGLRASLYVPTAYVGGTAMWLRTSGEERRPMLSWAALREIAVEGVEIGAHSHTHAQLDRLPIPELVDELRVSKTLLEDKLGARVDGLAYPFGYWSRATRSAVSRVGYRYACAVDDLVVAPRDDPRALPRLTVVPGLRESDFSALLATRSKAVNRQWTAAKRAVWRQLRRTSDRVGGAPYERGER
jgi:peptidoglycan/xylan/chitin deacetylase (PgdA/CDA1 family)